ncbi:TonB-dependent siderophore receptor [Sphingomonas bacterium]|uniref:TonB-dependent receptor plug domain-containing protein n=1 Tax=Sphingomonas bacterium TaxID=1895847 RepID=UPI0026346C23|nr:TonB-dependent receptor [Sphingomonas bacterium]
MAFFRSTPKQRLLTTVAPLGLLAMVAATPAFAQTTPAPTPAPSGQAATDDQSAPDIVITGSLLSRTDAETPSPVTVLTSENLARAGITSSAEAIRSVSADSAGSIGTGFQTGFSAGGSAVSLRGLGVSSTLVLINGLRSSNFPINDDGHNAYVDLNSIPFSLIDRIEVLKDGASSTYGADAIGGVVNLILKKTFTGIEGNVEGGVAERGDGSRYRASLTAGIGDYEAKGWNIYINGEYQRDGRISNHSRGFPYNTQDLSAIGGIDNNSADSSLTTATPSAVVFRTTQADLNNPRSGGTALLATPGTTLNLACPYGVYTAAAGQGCKYDLTDLYRQIQPLQERYSFNGKASIRIGDNVEGYVTGMYSRSFVSITSAFPSAIRNTQPFGGAPGLASSNPGIVLPVYICSAGVNCATAANRQLNPNNPYAAAFAGDPSNGAARIYYLFGDIAAGSDRTNEVYRVSAGLNGSFGGDWKWRVEGVGAWDDLSITQHGLLNIAQLMTAINTGSYNFVNPQLNSPALRATLAPDKTTPSYSSMISLDASISKELVDLPGGPLQIAVGGQVRREKLTNNNQNAALDTYGLTTSSAFGKHTVYAAYFELDAPILKSLDVNVSGRYDNYSEGFSHFSPKVGFKFKPIPEFAIRGTYSQGFRAPTFAESGPRSQFAGFVTTTPPCNFQLLHGGTGTTSTCASGGNPYNLAYSLGRGVAGNPNLQPETSRSFTAGAIFEPAKWFSMTVDYYNVKKSNLIVAGPLIGQAVTAYYSATNLAAATAAVAAVGPGYSVNTTDSIDPLFPAALPRVLIINVPFVNANYAITSGIDVAATAKFRFGDAKFTSRIEVTHIFKYDLHTSAGIQRYAGTFGPYDLSSGNGTPDWRGNWQNTLEVGAFSLSATAYYVGKIKEVSTDQQAAPYTTACSANLYKPTGSNGDPFCFVNSFINVDLNGSVKVNDKFTFYVNVGNIFDARAPVAPAAYASAPNFLTSWHYAGLVGRKFSAGANFKF